MEPVITFLGFVIAMVILNYMWGKNEEDDHKMQ